MSTIKSSAENLTLNADGANNDIKFQSNGSEVASIDQAGSLVLSGNLTSLGIDDNADATAITIDSSENVGIGVVPETWDANYDALQVGGNGSLAATPSQAAGGKTLLGQNMYVDSSYKYISTDEASLLYQQNGEFKFRVAPSGTADAAISWTTGLTIANNGQVTTGGDLIVGADVQLANGRGISFANMPNAGGMTSELLDDYEEGTWTPAPGSSTLTIYQAAWYTKIGNTVTCSCYVYSFGDNSSNTAFTITGLPFAHKTGSEAFFVVPASGGVGAQPSGAIGINARIGQNGSNGITFYNAYPNTSGGPALLHSHLGAFHLQFTFSYITA